MINELFVVHFAKIVVGLIMTSEIKVSVAEIFANRVSIVGRLGVPVGTVVAGSATSRNTESLLIRHGEKEIEFERDGVNWLEFRDFEAKVTTKDFREFSNEAVYCFETCCVIDYPWTGFFQHGDFLVKTWHKKVLSSLLLVRDDGSIPKDRLNITKTSSREITFAELDSELVKLTGSFGQLLEETLVGSVKFVDNEPDGIHVEVEVDGQSRKFKFENWQIYRTNELAMMAKPLSTADLLNRGVMRNIRFFERLVKVGEPIEFLPKLKSKKEFKLTTQLVLRFEF